MLRLTSPATELDEDDQPPVPPYCKTGRPSALKTLSNMRATACRTVATAVLQCRHVFSIGFYLGISPQEDLNCKPHTCVHFRNYGYFQEVEDIVRVLLPSDPVAIKKMHEKDK